MDIYIMRHGEAVHCATTDKLRALTVDGKRQSAEVAKYLKQELTGFDYAMVSPYRRAQQTFNQVNAFLPVRSIEIFEPLQPGGSIDKVLDYLHDLKHRHVSSVLIVSHLPLIAYLVAALCPSVPPLSFTTASVVFVTLLSKGLGTFQWIKTVN